MSKKPRRQIIKKEALITSPERSRYPLTQRPARRNKMNDQRSADRQAREFLYDLHNKANESGFKPSDKWQLSLATLAEKTAIEKNYHAAVTTKASPEVLAAMLAQVQTGLSQSSADAPEIAAIKHNHWQYLVAYNPERERR